METRNNQTVAFTGHRKERILQGFGNDPRILAQIREAVAGMVTELYGQGYKEYYTGMASGFNMTAAEAVLQVRERYEGIKGQFTLYGDTKKGYRPSFIKAAKPPLSVDAYELFLAEMAKHGLKDVQHGEFGAHMQVSLVNEGPCTIIIDTDEWKKKE